MQNAGVRRLANAGLASGQYTNFTFTTNVINQITGLMQSSDATPAIPTAASQTATFNALNQVTNLNSQSVAYDANGNLTSDGTRTYTWDAENRLIGVATTGSSGQSLSFSYDGFGRRTSIATTPSGGSTVTAAYLWCGLALCQARDATGAVTRGYLDEGEYVAGSTPKSLYYGLDQIGSVRRVFASDGTAPAYDYDPYGTPLQSTAPITDFGYASLFTAGNIGLNLATFRAYDPATGRWISRDPIGERGDPSGNLYGYVGQDPTNFMDRLGFSSINPILLCPLNPLACISLQPQNVCPYNPNAPGLSPLPDTNYSKPPDNAYDPNGPKAPGRPSADDGYIPPKGGDDWVPNPNGKGNGWRDANGDVWVPTGQGGAAHGGPHWDVQTPGGGYRNVRPRQQ